MDDQHNKRTAKRTIDLSLKALRILSTSISRWKDEASRLNIFSNSASVVGSVVAGVSEGVMGFEEEDGVSDDIVIQKGRTWRETQEVELNNIEVKT